jgi:PHP family Zn ribbon phosphoesterase
MKSYNLSSIPENTAIYFLSEQDIESISENELLKDYKVQYLNQKKLLAIVTVSQLGENEHANYMINISKAEDLNDQHSLILHSSLLNKENLTTAAINFINNIDDTTSNFF